MPLTNQPPHSDSLGNHMVVLRSRLQDLNATFAKATHSNDGQSLLEEGPRVDIAGGLSHPSRSTPGLNPGGPQQPEQPRDSPHSLPPFPEFGNEGAEGPALTEFVHQSGTPDDGLLRFPDMPGPQPQLQLPEHLPGATQGQGWQLGNQPGCGPMAQPNLPPNPTLFSIANYQPQISPPPAAATGGAPPICPPPIQAFGYSDPGAPQDVLPQRLWANDPLPEAGADGRGLDDLYPLGLQLDFGEKPPAAAVSFPARSFKNPRAFDALGIENEEEFEQQRAGANTMAPLPEGPSPATGGTVSPSAIPARHRPPAVAIIHMCRCFLESLRLSPVYFDAAYDECFLDEIAPDLPDWAIAGGRKYTVARNWVRFGLFVDPVRAGVDDIWDSWSISYHGTNEKELPSILYHRQLLFPGDTLLDGSTLEPNSSRPSKTYTSPSIFYSSLFAPPIQFTTPDGRCMHAQMVLQCMQRPGSFAVQQGNPMVTRNPCPFLPFSELEYASDTVSSVSTVPFGLLVRVCELAA